MSREKSVNGAVPAVPEITRRQLLKAGVGIGAGALLAGCVPATAPTPQPGAAAPATQSTSRPVSSDADHIRIAWYEENLTMDPSVTTMTPTLVLIRPCIFNGLVKQNPQGEIVPDLAVSWKAVDPLTWEFKLREGVKFHNGEPFDAESVKFTFEQLKDPARMATQAFLWGPVERTEIVDQYTVRIITNNPNGPMLRNLAIGCMLPPKAYDEEKFGTETIGTGPFRFVGWDRNQQVVMEANPDYWDGPPRAKKLTFFPIAEEATRIAGLRTGDLDIIFTVPVDQAKQLEGDENIRLEVILSCDTHVLSIGGEGRAPFDDHRIRQAIDYAVDREKLINGILNGYAEMPRSVISPMVFGFNPNLPPHPRDLAKAKALLEEAGKGAGLEATLDCVHGSLPKIEDLALALADDLSEVGINAKVQVHPDWAVGTPVLQQGNFDMFYNSWTTYTLDADMPFWRNWHTASSREIPEQGYSYSQELDALIEQGRYSLDDTERQEAYQKAQEFMWEYPTRMALYHSKDIWGVRSNVRGFIPTASRILDMSQVYKE